MFGATANVEFTTLAECGECKGSGSAQGAKPATCETCRGAGQVRMQQGFFAVQQTCPRCQGRGQVITDPCGGCRGQGRLRRQKTLAVKVPAGVDDGDRIRLTGEGEAGRNGGPAGDLYVEIRVREHKIFERDGSHLSCEVPMSFATASLGGTIEVPTLDGNATIKVPPETQSGRVFRLREKGIKPVRGGPTGDLFCRVVVETPVNLSREQKELLRSLEELAQERCQAASSARGFVAGRCEALFFHPRGVTDAGHRSVRCHGEDGARHPAPDRGRAMTSCSQAPWRRPGIARSGGTPGRSPGLHLSALS